MRETLTEFDVYQEAMRKINLNEEVMPIYNGKVLMNENADSYKKMQLILDTPELQKAHKFIYNLDPSQLSEDEIDQVNKIFSLGVNRGFIEDPDCSKAEEPPAETAVCDEPTAPAKQLPLAPSCSVKIPCWTVLYSATKNGEIKTGECYSNSIDPRSAKADCIAKLSRCGYENVSILALEQGDPDSCGFKDDDICSKAGCADEDEKALHEDDTECTNESDIDESGSSAGAFKMTLTLSDIDPETFLQGHVDQWINDVQDKYQAIEIKKGEMTENGTEVEVIGSYEVLEQIYADYLKYNSIYDFEKSQYDFDEFKSSIEKIDESSSLDESGNPYAAGLKTSDIGGVTKIGGNSKKKDKKPSLKEDDEDSSDEDAESDDSSDDNDSDDSSDDTSSEDDSTDNDSDDNSDDVSDDSDTSDDESDDSSDDSDDDSGSDDSSDDNDSDEEASSDDSDDSNEDDESGDSDDEDDSDEDDSDEDDSEEDDSEEDDSEEDDSDEDDSDEDDSDDEKKELSDEEKSELKNEYKKTFKDTLLKCKFEDRCFDDLTIKEKVKFFTELEKKWSKNEPSDFMTDKEIEQLNKIVVKK